MQKQNVRVIVAVEDPQAQDFLKGVVEGEGGAVIVGQAQDAVKALALARNLRPDVAIVDCYLPHVIGLDNIPMSRIGGLDTAQAISGEIPSTRVILLPELDKEAVAEHVAGLGERPFLSRKTNGSYAPFKLQELCREVVSPNRLVFANVEVKPWVAARQKGSGITNRVILFGGLGILGGWFLILTVFLAPVGVVLALTGAAAMLFGLAGRLTVSLWSKVSANERAKDKKVDAEN